MNAVVSALAFDAVSLYAAGDFTTAGGINANRVARWNGTSWSALSMGMNSNVNALATYNNGLPYASGAFYTTGRIRSNDIAKWGNGTRTTVTPSANPSNSGQSVTFTAVVTSTAGTPTGTMTFLDGNSSANVALSGGTATYTTASLSVGFHAIVGQYSGDSSFRGSASEAQTLTVNPVAGQNTSATALAASPNPSSLGDIVAFTATVTSAVGTPTGSVIFKDGGTSLGSAAVSGGVAVYAGSSLSIGSHSITAEYSGDSTHNASTSPVLTQIVTPFLGNKVYLPLDSRTYAGGW